MNSMTRYVLVLILSVVLSLLSTVPAFGQEEV